LPRVWRRAGLLDHRGNYRVLRLRHAYWHGSIFDEQMAATLHIVV